MTRDELIVYLKIAAPVFPSIYVYTVHEEPKVLSSVREPGGYVDLVRWGGGFSLYSVHKRLVIDRHHSWQALATRYGFTMENWSR